MPKIVDHDRYRQEILTKCFDLFAQRGYGSLTMRQIAKEIGVSTGTLYHYFSSKEDLFVQLIEEITEQDILHATDLMENQSLDTMEEKILALGQFIFKNEDYFYKQTLLYMNFFQQLDLEQQQLVEAVKRSYKRYQEETMEFLGIYDLAIANHISCFIDGLIFQRAFDPESLDIQQQMDLLAKMLSAYLSSKHSDS
ncbi:TetR family transcriptional regulator [Hyella patelloides LEGE 07179]|uniref:TetR family transcriptional regulator n=1 Tax=Hyella patelloides LEGE 07179 TaxID=945734 RepID=A0A563VJ09_9CYAN|nr:TetR/AcrR family transcriptional regulator [Hyella patelloides]VEP11428.1 TetR family transcriptional regulator [Hyella patelloides LEGE 07179]